MEDKDGRYLAGQIRNDAKQAVSGYALAIDLQDEKGKSIRKFAGLMLMNAMALQAGETKDFKERILSQEPDVKQAVVYFKKAGTEQKLCDPASCPVRVGARGLPETTDFERDIRLSARRYGLQQREGRQPQQRPEQLEGRETG